MLNLLEIMKQYGPLINLWEGSNKGEGYLRYAKPMTANIHSKNWYVNAILKLLNKISLDNIIDYYMQNGCKYEEVKNSYVSVKKCLKFMLHTK